MTASLMRFVPRRAWLAVACLIATACPASTESTNSPTGDAGPDSRTGDVALATGQLLPVGSACSADGQCGATPFTCVIDHPDGYCTRPCDIAHADADCPAESICQFDGTEGECHARCSTKADCRTGYLCAPASAAADNKASHAFCDMDDMAGMTEGDATTADEVMAMGETM